MDKVEFSKDTKENVTVYVDGKFIGFMELDEEGWIYADRFTDFKTLSHDFDKSAAAVKKMWN